MCSWRSIPLKQFAPAVKLIRLAFELDSLPGAFALVEAELQADCVRGWDVEHVGV